MTYQISYGFNDLNVNGLVYACWSRNLEQLKKEIADGVDVNSSDPDGVTAITYASNEQGFIDGVRLLLEAGADPTIRGNRPPYHAIRAACSFGHLDILRLYEKFLQDKKTLLSLFPGSYPEEIYKFLGPYLKAADLKVPGSQLILNIQSDSCEEQLNMILNSVPVDINFQDENGKTALHYYVEQPGMQAAMVKRFLEAGLNPNIKDHEGNTALKILMNSFHRSRVEEKISSTLIRSYGGRYETVTGFRDWLKKLLL